MRENDLCKLEALDAAPVFRRLGFCFVVRWVGFFLSEKKGADGICPQRAVGNKVMLCK